MPTNLAIDDRLLQEAQKVGRHRTKRKPSLLPWKSTSTIANSKKILSLFGKIDYERDYDYKRERKARRT